MIKPIPMFELNEEFETSAVPLFTIFKDAERWPAGSVSRVLTVREPNTVILAFTDSSRVTIEVESLGAGRSGLRVLHELITSQEALKEHKKFWRDYLKTVRKQVER